jgi:hypothetical protein
LQVSTRVSSKPRNRRASMAFKFPEESLSPFSWREGLSGCAPVTDAALRHAARCRDLRARRPR